MIKITQKVDALWLDVNIATFADHASYSVLNDACLAVTDGKISWIGHRQDLPFAPEKFAAVVHSANSRWITPGLIDCHTHLVYAGDRANEFSLRLQGASYETIARAGGGIRSTVAATRAASEEQLYEVSRKRLAALLAEGVTTIEIKSGYGLDLANELKMLRVARQLGKNFPVLVKTTFLGAHALPEEYADRADAYIDFLCNELLPAACAEQLVDAVDAFCERIGFTLQQTARIFDAAKQHHLPVKLHAEQLSDSSGALLAAKYHALSADHLEYASKEAVAAMARAGTVAVLLPCAFYFLHEDRVPPIEWFREYRVPMAIATDSNPGTSPVTSLLLVLNMACTLFRLTPEEALAGVTCHAAKALGLEKTHGTLEVGKIADFVVWDIKHPAELAYRMGFNPCVAVVKEGKRYDRK